MPEFFLPKVDLFVAMAPALLFKHSSEQFFKELAQEHLLQSLVVSMDLLEYTGYTYTDDDQIICEMKPTWCE
jgi:hypothetical protein